MSTKHRSNDKSNRQSAPEAVTKPAEQPEAPKRRYHVKRGRIEELRQARPVDAERSCHPMLPVVQRVARKVREELELSVNAARMLSMIARSTIADFESKPTGMLNTLLWLCWAYRVRMSDFFLRVEQEFEQAMPG